MFSLTRAAGSWKMVGVRATRGSSVRTLRPALYRYLFPSRARMVFPQTRLTLIERLAGGGNEADWRAFLHDYWGPVCRLARQRGSPTVEDAEDVAAETLEAIVKNNLLARWSANRSAKLRTLICAVVRNILANRARVASGREHLVRDHGGQLDRYVEFAIEWSRLGDFLRDRGGLEAAIRKSSGVATT